MTDRQFDAYIKSLLHHLEDASEEIKAITNGIESAKLKRVMDDLKDQLKRP